MSSPRDRDGDGFDDRPDDGSGWREPAHLGGERAAAEPTAASPRAAASGSRRAGTCPPADPDRTDAARRARQERTGGPRFGDGPRAPDPMERAFTLRDRPRRRAGLGAAARLDGLRRRAVPQDAVLAELVASAPVRARQGAPAGQRAARPRRHPGAGRLRRRLPVGPVARAAVRGHRGARCSAPCRASGSPRPGSGSTAPAGSCRSPAANEAFDAPLAAARGRGRPAGAPPRRRTPPSRACCSARDDGDEFWTGAGHRRGDPARRSPAAADRAPRPAAHRRRRCPRRRLLSRSLRPGRPALRPARTMPRTMPPKTMPWKAAIAHQ